MHFEDLHHWQGTADTFTDQLRRKVEQLGLLIEPPSLRTVRLWRSKKLLSQPKGQNFGFRQILEGLATALLLKKGWTLAAIADILPAFEDMTLEQQIVSEANGKNPAWSGVMETQPSLLSQQEYPRKSVLAEEAVILLAQGILRQYARILDRREIVRQDDGLPPELQSAMCKLGRLYIEAGQCDRAACVHDVLDRARSSLNDEKWGLEIFRQSSFRFSKVILIDPDLRVPTSDCSVVANISGAFGEDNVIEHRLHALLRDATERLGVRRQHAAYTSLRELFGRSSLIGERELLEYLSDHKFTPLQGTIIEFFDPVPDIWLIAGLAYRCAHCGTLMRPHPDTSRYPEGRCPIRQCNSKYLAKVSERLDPKAKQLLIAKPQILTYWTGPAIDELEIFDEAKRYGLSAELYPESDLCDISINDYEIGIDAKSYSSPVSLALRLNRSIGGLIHYRRRIIAVSDELVADNPSYLSILRSLLDKKGDSTTLEILSVSSVIQLLRSIKHAYQA